MKKVYILAVLLLSIMGCERTLDDINANPNAPEVISPQFLLSNVLWEAANENSIQGWHAGNLVAQLTSNIEFLPVDRYDMGNNTGYWDHLYRLMNDIKSMQESSEPGGAYYAVGDILKAWIASQLTDLWGPVPYFEAVKGASDEVWSPAFNTQEEIYTADGGILDLLRTAATTLGTTTEVLSGDIMYGGDLNSWARLANSLRVRYLLRISKREDVSNELESLATSGNLMASNLDNGTIDYLTSAPNQWAIFNERVGRYTDVRMSETVDVTMNGLDDPRTGILFKTTSVSPTAYKGLPNGLSRDSQTAFDLSDISLVGSFFRDIPDGPNANFMHYSELQFALAEAAHAGLISGSASNYYEEGIRASFEYYGVSADVNDYLTNPLVMLDGTNDMERIMTQKWISLFLVGHEAWFNIRRTGFPQLTIPADNLNGNVFPVRYRYPESEQAVNGTNYNVAVGILGADDYNQKSWWEQ